MIYYVSEELGLVLTEEEYNKEKDYYCTQENEEGEELFIDLECDLKIGDELTLYDLDECMSAFAHYFALEKFELSGILKHEFIAYELVDGWWVKVRFKVLELVESDDEMEVLESKVKITNIELV